MRPTRRLVRPPRRARERLGVISSASKVSPVRTHILDTASGKKLDLDDPQPRNIHLDDIAGALSRVCRFGRSPSTSIASPSTR